jgi:cell envelope opacity-associated protein A
MIESGFTVTSVTPVDPPSKSEGSDWHCYTICQGKNTMRGFRRGDLRDVTAAAEAIAEQLNERRFGKRARVQLVMTSEKTSRKDKRS